ncbi:hypothetical protein DFQ26_006513, partial [Actinomortierella ambigua]
MGSASRSRSSVSQQPTPWATDVDYDDFDQATNRMQLGFSDYDRACREVDNDSRRFYFLLAHEVFSMESIKQDPVAQILASEMSLKGLGTPTDRKIAILFLTMAANRGHLLAQGLLAEARLGGDTTEAGCKATREPIDFRTTRLKAEQGNVVSQFKLHSMYRDGVGVERDPVQAMAWLNKAVGGRIEIGRACSPGLSTLVEQPKPSRAK